MNKNKMMSVFWNKGFKPEVIENQKYIDAVKKPGS